MSKTQRRLLCNTGTCSAHLATLCHTLHLRFLAVGNKHLMLAVAVSLSNTLVFSLVTGQLNAWSRCYPTQRAVLPLGERDRETQPVLTPPPHAPPSLPRSLAPSLLIPVFGSVSLPLFFTNPCAPHALQDGIRNRRRARQNWRQ